MNGVASEAGNSLYASCADDSVEVGLRDPLASLTSVSAHWTPPNVSVQCAVYATYCSYKTNRAPILSISVTEHEKGEDRRLVVSVLDSRLEGREFDTHTMHGWLFNIS